MAVNRDKPDKWKSDISQSVDLYNDWFLKFAPDAFRSERVKATAQAKKALEWTNNMINVSTTMLMSHPEVLPFLRMSTCPPIARDRLIGLAGVSKSMILRMERDSKLPMHLTGTSLDVELRKIGSVIEKLADPDIFPWLRHNKVPTKVEMHRAASIVADRMCGAATDPIVRNAQEVTYNSYCFCADILILVILVMKPPKASIGSGNTVLTISRSLDYDL